MAIGAHHDQICAHIRSIRDKSVANINGPPGKGLHFSVDPVLSQVLCHHVG